MTMRRSCHRPLASCVPALVSLAPGGALAFAGVLPEDRADVLYHRYQGGGVTIQGPSVLVRKKIGENFVGARQLLHRHGVQRVDRREALRQPVQGDERKQKSLSVRLPARQDHLQRRRHQQQRERLQGRHGVLLG